MRNCSRNLAKTMRVALLVLPALALGLTLSACRQSGEDAGAKGKPGDSEREVEVVQALRKSLPRVVEQPGSIQAYEQTQLYARVAGYVRLRREGEGRIAFDIGRTVRGPVFDSQGKVFAQGETLAELVVPELEEDVKQKDALTRQADAEVEQARKALAAAEANIASMDAGVAEAKALLARWESESVRVAKMVKNGVLDSQAKDETQNQFKAAAARLRLTEAAVVKAKADRDKATADVTAARAKVDVTHAVAGRAKVMLDYAQIRAPFDGIIIARRVNTGDFVQPSGGKGEWLFTVARLHPMRVVISIPEADAAMLDLAQSEVSLQIPALSVPALPGPIKITRNSWALDPATRALRAELDIPNKDGRLRPGMYVHARIVNPTPERWTLPTTALVKRDEAHSCCQIDEEGKVVYRRVQVGRGDGKRVEILRCQKLAAPNEWEELTGSEVFALRPSGLLEGQKVRKMPAAK